MIVNYFFPKGSAGFYDKPSIYLRTRDKEGNLSVKIIHPEDKDYIRPFCWLPAGIHPKRLARLSTAIRGIEFHHNEKGEGKNGENLFKVSFDTPNDLKEISRMTETFEADHPYEDSILFQLYPEKRSMPEFHPRIWYFDLEWNVATDNEFTTVMAVDDTHATHPIVFAWSQESMGMEGVEIDFIDREGGYERRLYGSEHEMHNGFLEHLDTCDPDILIAHSITWADLPHLIRRLDNPDRLSPVGDVYYPRKEKGYYFETDQPIIGRLILDTAAMGTSGSGIETLFAKSGKSLPNRKLQTIAEELGFEGKIQADEEGNKLDVITWWYSHFDLFVDYCLVDTTLLRNICEATNFVPYFTAMQNVCGVKISSTHNVTNFIRGLFARETNLKAPSRMHYKRDKLTAANVFALMYGLLNSIALLDYKSLYPSIILAYNICPTTKVTRMSVDEFLGEDIVQTPDGSYWDTRKKGILPSIVKDLLDLRTYYKEKMHEATDDKERSMYDMLQLAAKVNANSCYGYVAQKGVGGMWVDADCGAAITSSGRLAVETLRKNAEALGYAVAAGHTDSCYIQIPFEEVNNAVEIFNTEINKELNSKGLLEVEFEAFFDYFFIGRGRKKTGKNRNFGLFSWPESKRGKLKVTGYELKSASSSPLTKEVQDILFRMVSENKKEEDISNLIRDISLKLRKGEYTAEEIAPHGKLGKEKYAGIPPMAARGMLYYNEYISTINLFRVNERAQWVYVAETPNNLPYTKSISFREEKEIEDFEIDYNKCVTKFIRAKIDTIYDELGWDVDFACGEKIAKRYW
jgi:DNA polymerase I